MVLELECKVNTESVGTDGRILVTLVGTCGIADARNLRIETCITGDGCKVVNGTINTETLDEIVLETEVVTEGHVVYLPVVTILDIEMEEEMTFQIVGTSEANIDKGHMSDESPIGKALVGHAVGETVTAEALIEKGILHECKYGYKVLGNGSVTKKVTVKASAFSESAKNAIEAAGGKAEVM